MQKGTLPPPPPLHLPWGVGEGYTETELTEHVLLNKIKKIIRLKKKKNNKSKIKKFPKPASPFNETQFQLLLFY